jgi:hypothetical protein
VVLNSDGGVHEVPVPGVPGRLWLCGKHVVGPAPESLLAALPAPRTSVSLSAHHSGRASRTSASVMLSGHGGG